jgi:putative molybdopterin biosynthesis protein
MASELVLPANTEIGAAEIGGLLAAGITEIEVKKKPEVAILATGTELIEPGEELIPGKIIEYNSRVIANKIEEWGGNPSKIDKVKDDFKLIKEKVDTLSREYDLVLVIAGSSAGEEDYTAQIIKDLGELLFHGVAIKPGKPVMAGVINEKLVIGLPGYPVAAYLDTLLFVQPVVKRFLGLSSEKPLQVEAKLTQDLTSKLGQEEFVRTKLVEINDILKAVPLKRGAGVINSVMQADGFMRIPALSQGLKQKEIVEVELKKKRDYEENLLIVGEKSFIFDLLINQSQLNFAQVNPYFKNLDNEDSLEALEQKSANMAVFKAIDYEYEGKLNSIKKEYEDLVIVDLVKANLGLAFRKQGPKGINELKDVFRDDLSFVTRPEGVVARRLLDSKLQNLEIDDKLIIGQSREEETDLGVANLIKKGIADIGIIDQAVSKLFGLEFMQLGKVRFSLLIPKHEFNSKKVQSLLKIIKSNDFIEKVKKVVGYDLKKIGEVVYRK